jgi:hypothetical protein
MPSGETFAMKHAMEDAVDAAAAKGGGTGTGNSFDDLVGDVEKKVSNLYYAKKILDENFPGTGLLPGRDYIPTNVYKAVKPLWDAANVYPPDKGDIAYEYYDWLGTNATAPDHSVKGFLNQREQAGPGKSVEMPLPQPGDIAAQQGVVLSESTALPKRTPDGKIDTTGMLKVTPNQPLGLYTGPSMGNPQIGQVVLQQGMPLYVTQRQNGWAEVVAPGDTIGWVPEAGLLYAA